MFKELFSNLSYKKLYMLVLGIELAFAYIIY